MDFIAGLTGFSEEKIVADLQGVIFKDFGGESGKSGFVPVRSELQRVCMQAANEFEGYKQFLSARPYVTADEYLSGNVREKLEVAKSLDHAITQRDSQSDHGWGDYSLGCLQQAAHTRPGVCIAC